jgi:hypothetical protein
MAVGLWALSGIPAEPSLGRVIWPLALVGLGVGATFPAVSIGSMGSVRGQELGLASGIVNMARQVGFAIGVALLVAVFTGTVDDTRRDAAREVAAVVGKSFSQEDLDRISNCEPGTACESLPGSTEFVKGVVNEHERDAYGAAFRVAAFVTLLAIPFSLTMRRRPSEAGPSEAPGVA